MLGRPDFTFIVYLGVGDVIAVVVVVFVSWQTKVIPVIIQFCNCCRKLSRGGPFICCFSFARLNGVGNANEFSGRRAGDELVYGASESAYQRGPSEVGVCRTCSSPSPPSPRGP